MKDLIEDIVQETMGEAIMTMRKAIKDCQKKLIENGMNEEDAIEQAWSALEAI